MAEADPRAQAREAGPVGGGGARAAKIIIDDDDLVAPPAEPACAIRQSILEARRFPVLLNFAALPGSLRHPVSGRDPQEGDDDDRDSSFWWDRFRPGWTHVAQAQARCGATPVAGGGPGDTLARTGRDGFDPERMAGPLRGGR